MGEGLASETITPLASSHHRCHAVYLTPTPSFLERTWSFMRDTEGLTRYICSGCVQHIEEKRKEAHRDQLEGLQTRPSLRKRSDDSFLLGVQGAVSQLYHCSQQCSSIFALPSENIFVSLPEISVLRGMPFYTRCCNLIGQPNVPDRDTKTAQDGGFPRPLVIYAYACT